jgi:LuxR family maltose regulon positive regulatory protein
VAGLLKAARSDAANRKVLDESPDLCGLMDPLQGLALPQPEPDAPRGSTQAGALSLTPRQCHILGLIAVGRSNKEIARITGITPETVKTHVKNIFVKLAVEKRAQAVARAHMLGLVGAPVHEGTTVF